MEIVDILDVTRLEPALKHPRIFEKFDALSPRQAFIIHNDHDPKPLYYQLLGQKGKQFTWEYLEKGPSVWRIKITKTEPVESQETVGQIVAGDFRKAQVFKKWGIDFCCGGKKTLEQACDKKGVDVQQLKAELQEVEQQINPATNFDKWDLGFLADYIVEVHHNYVKENSAFMMELAGKVARVHGNEHPELIEVARIFKTVAADLGLHLMKEENVLFPYIRQMAAAEKGGEKISRPPFDSVNNPAQMMEVEHEQAGEDMEAIRRLTQNYTLPPDACSSYTVLYKKLEEFENDLFNHVHLENNILFPKAIELEKKVMSGEV